MANDALKIVTQDDVEQAKRPLGRVGFPISADTIDPAKLMDMLGDIDSLKREIQDRMRRIEAVKQAKSLLMEDAQRTEALNKRLAEIGKVMAVVHSGFLLDESVFEGATVMGPRLAPLPQVHEGVALAWPKADEAAKPAVAAVEIAEPISLETVPLKTVSVDAVSVDAVEAETIQKPEGAIEAAQELDVAEAVATDEPDELVDVERADAATGVSLRCAEELVQEARRLLEESSARLDMAVQREEQVTADLLLNQETFASTFEAASERLGEAERCWKLADAAAGEAKRLFEDSTAQLTLAVSKEQQSAADFHAAQKALEAAYETVGERLAAAERFAKEGEGIAEETRTLLQRMETELAEARRGAAAASEDLLSARQELTTAYQFASVAAQRRLDAAEFYRKTASAVVFSSALAWMVAVWMAWVAFNRVLPYAVPFAASCLILAAAVFLRRQGERELEEP